MIRYPRIMRLLSTSHKLQMVLFSEISVNQTQDRSVIKYFLVLSSGYKIQRSVSCISEIKGPIVYD